MTATVESIPLIASSIMSKKLAGGSDCIVLDVKVGSGAFMKNREDAMALAKAMVSIGSHAGRKTAALLTDMSQPLGLAVGNALEVEEACQVLLGKGPEDVRRLSVELAAMMVWLTENAPNLEEARRLAEEKLRDGSAAETFRRVIRAQGGDPNVVDHPEILPRAACVREVFAEKDGWIGCMDTQGVGRSSVLLGAGRETGVSVPDPGAGIRFLKKTGDPVKKGEPFAILYASEEKRLDEGEVRLRQAVPVAEIPPETMPLFLGRAAQRDGKTEGVFFGIS